MKLFFVTAFIIASTVVSAQEAPKRFALPPISAPVLTSGNPQWQAGIVRCFEQANKRRTQFGVNTRPVFYDTNGRPFGGIPPADANFRCDAAGRHDGMVRMSGTR
ncbi:MAG: hypothetical protein JWO50_202 [Candidatus Kaiserbacteria bacterium]|nr:hypothetical protein [Candidatus Kaiserbacteria bacterium]